VEGHDKIFFWCFAPDMSPTFKFVVAPYPALFLRSYDAPNKSNTKKLPHGTGQGNVDGCLYQQLSAGEGGGAKLNYDNVQLYICLKQ